MNEEYRGNAGYRQTTHFFSASLSGQLGNPQTTQEDEIGIAVNWFSIEEAIAFLERQIKTLSYQRCHSCFNIRTHLAALKEFQK